MLAALTDPTLTRSSCPDQSFRKGSQARCLPGRQASSRLPEPPRRLAAPAVFSLGSQGRGNQRMPLRMCVLQAALHLLGPPVLWPGGAHRPPRSSAAGGEAASAQSASLPSPRQEERELWIRPVWVSPLPGWASVERAGDDGAERARRGGGGAARAAGNGGGVPSPLPPSGLHMGTPGCPGSTSGKMSWGEGRWARTPRVPRPLWICQLPGAFLVFLLHPLSLRSQAQRRG